MTSYSYLPFSYITVAGSDQIYSVQDNLSYTSFPDLYAKIQKLTDVIADLTERVERLEFNEIDPTPGHSSNND